MISFNTIHFFQDHLWIDSFQWNDLFQYHLAIDFFQDYLWVDFFQEHLPNNSLQDNTLLDDEPKPQLGKSCFSVKSTHFTWNLCISLHFTWNVGEMQWNLCIWCEIQAFHVKCTFKLAFQHAFQMKCNEKHTFHLHFNLYFKWNAMKCMNFICQNVYFFTRDWLPAVIIPLSLVLFDSLQTVLFKNSKVTDTSVWKSAILVHFLLKYMYFFAFLHFNWNTHISNKMHAFATEMPKINFWGLGLSLCKVFFLRKTN